MLLLAVIVIVIASWLSLTVPPHPARSSTATITGNVIGTYPNGSTEDITIRLHNDNGTIYYINHGTKHLDAGQLDNDLRNQPVTLAYYNGGFDLLGMQDRLRHICEVSYNGKVIYTEIED